MHKGYKKKSNYFPILIKLTIVSDFTSYLIFRPITNILMGFNCISLFILLIIHNEFFDPFEDRWWRLIVFILITINLSEMIIKLIIIG